MQVTVNLGGVSTWTLCKPYSYFEKVAAVRARAAASACGVTPPTLPKRKILIFDNKTLLANLGTYMGRVVDLLKFWQRTQSSLPDGSTNSDVGAKKAALQRLLREHHKASQQEAILKVRVLECRERRAMIALLVDVCPVENKSLNSL